MEAAYGRAADNFSVIFPRRRSSAGATRTASPTSSPGASASRAPGPRRAPRTPPNPAARGSRRLLPAATPRCRQGVFVKLKCSTNRTFGQKMNHFYEIL